MGSRHNEIGLYRFSLRLDLSEYFANPQTGAHIEPVVVAQVGEDRVQLPLGVLHHLGFGRRIRSQERAQPLQRP